MIIKKSSKGFKIENFSKKDWMNIGKQAGWITSSDDDDDFYNFMHGDKCQGCGKKLTQDEEEERICGKCQSADDNPPEM